MAYSPAVRDAVEGLKAPTDRDSLAATVVALERFSERPGRLRPTVFVQELEGLVPDERLIERALRKLVEEEGERLTHIQQMLDASAAHSPSGTPPEEGEEPAAPVSTIGSAVEDTSVAPSVDEITKRADVLDGPSTIDDGPLVPAASALVAAAAAAAFMLGCYCTVVVALVLDVPKPVVDTAAGIALLDLLVLLSAVGSALAASRSPPGRRRSTGTEALRRIGSTSAALGALLMTVVWCFWLHSSRVTMLASMDPGMALTWPRGIPGHSIRDEYSGEERLFELWRPLDSSVFEDNVACIDKTALGEFERNLHSPDISVGADGVMRVRCSRATKGPARLAEVPVFSAHFLDEMGRLRELSPKTLNEIPDLVTRMNKLIGSSFRWRSVVHVNIVGSPASPTSGAKVVLLDGVVHANDAVPPAVFMSSHTDGVPSLKATLFLKPPGPGEYQVVADRTCLAPPSEAEHGEGGEQVLQVDLRRCAQGKDVEARLVLVSNYDSLFTDTEHQSNWVLGSHAVSEDSATYALVRGTTDARIHIPRRIYWLDSRAPRDFRLLRFERPDDSAGARDRVAQAVAWISANRESLEGIDLYAHWLDAAMARVAAEGPTDGMYFTFDPARVAELRSGYLVEFFYRDPPSSVAEPSVVSGPRTLLSPSVLGAIARYRDSLVSELKAVPVSHQSMDAWQAAQIALALDRQGRTRELLDHIERERDREVGLWWKWPVNVPVHHWHDVAGSGWSMYALARFGRAVPHDSIQAMLRRQTHGGAWPMAPEIYDLPDGRRLDSTYATAWALLALQQVAADELLPASLRSDVRDALEDGCGWLAKSQVDGDWPWFGGDSHRAGAPLQFTAGLAAVRVCGQIDVARAQLRVILATSADVGIRSGVSERDVWVDGGVDGVIGAAPKSERWARDNNSLLPFPWAVLMLVEAWPKLALRPEERLKVGLWIGDGVEKLEHQGYPPFFKAEVLIALNALLENEPGP